MSKERPIPGCTANAKGDCEHCSINREMNAMVEYDPEILKHMGESGCIIAKEEVEAYWSEMEAAEIGAEEEMAEMYDELAGGEWEGDDDDYEGEDHEDDE